jgi:hypothetical protein
MPDNSAGLGDRYLMRTHARYAEDILMAAGSTSRILELGPDVGFTLQALTRGRHNDRIAAIEPNGLVHDVLTRRVPGIEIYPCVQDVPNDSEFGLVVAIHVLDHLLNPVWYLQQVAKLAVQGARLAIVVHDEASLARRVLGTRWPPFCLQHPQLFTGDTLSGLVRKAGWSASAPIPTTNYLPLGHPISVLSQVLPGIPTIGLGHNSGPGIHLRLGNMMMLASKPENPLVSRSVGSDRRSSAS